MTFDCVGPVTTWVDGLEETTAEGKDEGGNVMGRPIGFGIDKVLKFPKGTYESTFEVAASTKIYYYCPDGDGTLETRETTPDLVEKGYTAAQTAALGLSDPMFAVDPTDYGLPPCPESARNETVVTTGARLPRPDAETRARALPPLTRPPLSPADELSCTCDKGTTFCTRVESGHVTMLSPVEVAVVVICVLIVVLVAICMCAFAAKKKMIVKEVKHGPGNAL